MNISFTMLIAAALMLPVSANAQTPAPQAAPAGAKETDATKDRVICRRVEVTGSLVKRGKVCKPAGEWARIIERGNDNARRTIESGMACAGGPTCNPGS